jgi:CAP-Gly domain-containing linker protein 1
VKAGEVEMQRRLDAVVRERDSTLTRAQEMSDKLLDVEKERDSLQEVVVRSSGEIDRLQEELEEITRSHRLLENEVESESGALHQRLEVAEETLWQRERELAEARERISNLSDELVISQGKRDQMMLEEEKELLEEEKELLEERVRELTVQLEQAQSSKSVADELGEMDAPSQEEVLSMHQSIQDYEQQVEFLNSVISDLQQKLEAAELLQLMETGDIPISDDEGVAQLPPPRLFCDICDQFDLHDTDDCPLQTTTSDSPPPSSYGAARAPGGSDRPYCTNCEVFGHAAEECEYDVTY